jgi:hypothetical protein
VLIMADEFVFGDPNGGVSWDEDRNELTVWDGDYFPSTATLSSDDLAQLITVLRIAQEKRRV